MVSMSDKRIMIFVDWFEPGYKAGGPIRSCSNFAQHVKDQFSIYIFTGDRDLGDTHPYEDIVRNKWTDFDRNIKVYYASPEEQNLKSIYNHIKVLDPAYIYLNSMYSMKFT